MYVNRHLVQHSHLTYRSIEAMKHPRNVGWGEIGLDYHYDNSPREIQQEVLIRQLRHAVRLGKPLTIHTREAEEDTERILKAEVPKDHKVRIQYTYNPRAYADAMRSQIHVHCYTDSPEWAARMLLHFPNLFIGVTGSSAHVICPCHLGYLSSLL